MARLSGVHPADGQIAAQAELTQPANATVREGRAAGASGCASTFGTARSLDSPACTVRRMNDNAALGGVLLILSGGLWWAYTSDGGFVLGSVAFLAMASGLILVSQRR